MTKRTTTARPISAQLLQKVRKREHHSCPYCGVQFNLADAIRVRSMGYYMVECSNPDCTVGFFLPLSRSFDPSVPAPVKLDAYKWVECPFCKSRFQFKSKYEQCPCCGKVLFEQGSRFALDLKDNSAKVVDVLAKFRKENRPWWRFA